MTTSCTPIYFNANISTFLFQDADNYQAFENAVLASSSCMQKREKEKKLLDEMFWQENAHMTYPPAKKSEFTQIQLDKVGLLIAEATKRIEREQNSKIPNQKELSTFQDKSKAKDEDVRTYETEVASGNQENVQVGLRTRRVSDTQVSLNT